MVSLGVPMVFLWCSYGVPVPSMILSNPQVSQDGRLVVVCTRKTMVLTKMTIRIRVWVRVWVRVKVRIRCLR